MTDPARQWIAQVCREHREKHRFKRSDVASDIGREGDAIRNFETLRGLWSPLTGAIVESYATRSGLTSLDLWAEALRRWESAEKDSAQSTARPRVDQDTRQQGRNLDKSMASLRDSAAARRAAQSKRREGR